MAIRKAVRRAKRAVSKTVRRVNVVKAVRGVRKAKRAASISALNLRNRKFNARQKSIGSSKRRSLINPKTLKRVKRK